VSAVKSSGGGSSSNCPGRSHHQSSMLKLEYAGMLAFGGRPVVRKSAVYCTPESVRSVVRIEGVGGLGLLDDDLEVDVLGTGWLDVLGMSQLSMVPVILDFLQGGMGGGKGLLTDGTVPCMCQPACYFVSIRDTHGAPFEDRSCEPVKNRHRYRYFHFMAALSLLGFWARVQGRS
jgi:hypothetical protein